MSEENTQPTASAPDAPQSTPPPSQDGDGVTQTQERDLASASRDVLLEIITELRGENAKHRTKKQEFKQQVEELAPLQTELQQLQAKLASIETAKEQEFQSEITSLREKVEAEAKARQEAELAALKLQVGQEFNLPPSLAGRLQGETLEQLQADAQALAKELPSPVQRGRLLNGAAPPAANLARELNDYSNGQTNRAFDLSDGLKRGGVIFNSEK